MIDYILHKSEFINFNEILNSIPFLFFGSTMSLYVVGLNPVSHETVIKDWIFSVPNKKTKKNYTRKVFSGGCQLFLLFPTRKK